MTEMHLDPILAQWLRDGAEVGPEHGLQRALATARRVHQRPGWTFPSWWLPARVVGFDIRISPTLAVGLLLVIAIVLLAMGAVFVGTNRSPAPSGEQRNLIAFQGGSMIYMAGPDGSDRRQLTSAVPFARLPVFSPDGKRVAFLAPTGAGTRDGSLLVIPVDGVGQLVDVTYGIQIDPADVPQMTWSPDGSRIAFAGTNGGVSTIFVTASDGTGPPVPITDGTAHRDSPTWSPDGDWIGFREWDLDGTRVRLRRASPDGTTVEEITLVIGADAYLSKLRWIEGTDATSYWYNPGSGSDTSAYIDLGLGHKNEPWTGTPGGTFDTGVLPSPDGTKPVFLTGDEGVTVADYDGTEPYGGQLRRLGPVADCWVDWAPSGDALYGGAPDGCNGVVVIPLADPAAAFTVPGSTVGVASWQPHAE